MVGFLILIMTRVKESILQKIPLSNYLEIYQIHLMNITTDMEMLVAL